MLAQLFVRYFCLPDSGMDEIKKAAKASAKTGDPSQLEEAIARQRALETPAPKRYKSEDPVVEKLSELLSENPRGLLIHRDELSGWLRSLDKQGRESDQAFYLESWNGTGTFDVAGLRVLVPGWFF